MNSSSSRFLPVRALALDGVGGDPGGDGGDRERVIGGDLGKDDLRGAVFADEIVSRSLFPQVFADLLRRKKQNGKNAKFARFRIRVQR